MEQEIKTLSENDIAEYLRTTNIHLGIPLELVFNLQRYCRGCTFKILKYAFLAVSRLMSMQHCLSVRELQEWIRGLCLKASNPNFALDPVIEHQTLTVELAFCPNVYKFQEIFTVQHRELSAYFIEPLACLIADYAIHYVQQFKVGMTVAIYVGSRFYLSKIATIVTMGDFSSFLLLTSEPYDFFDEYDWIEASNENLVCFYNSHGKLVEKAKLTPLYKRKDNEWCDLFRPDYGDWIQSKQINSAYEVVSELGTFTS